MKFAFEPIWDIDWEQEVAEANESDLPFKLAYGRAAFALKYMNGATVTASHLGWLTLWTRGFQAADDSRFLAHSNSDFSLKLLARSIEDSRRDVRSIIKLATSRSQTDTGVLREIRRGLAEYAAWCLWNDTQAKEWLLDKRNMDALYDPEPARGILGSALQREMFGYSVVGMSTDTEELNRRRRDHEERLYSDIEEIRSLISTLGLDSTWGRLEEAKRERSFFNSFVEFLNGHRSSVARQMLQDGIGFGYALYQERSSIAHGSTVGAFIHFDDGTFTPMLRKTDEIVLSHAHHVASISTWIFTMLAAIAQFWDEAGQEY